MQEKKFITKYSKKKEKPKKQQKMLSASFPVFSLTQKFSDVIGYPGAPTAPLTKEFAFGKGLPNPIPIFQIMNKDGKIVNQEYMDEVEKMLPKERMLAMYHSMCKIRIIDDLFVVAQRQVCFSFCRISHKEIF